MPIVQHCCDEELRESHALALRDGDGALAVI